MRCWQYIDNCTYYLQKVIFMGYILIFRYEVEHFKISIKNLLIIFRESDVRIRYIHSPLLGVWNTILCLDNKIEF